VSNFSGRKSEGVLLKIYTGLLDGTDEDPRWKLRRYIITVAAGIILAVVLPLLLYFGLHVPEKRAAAHFLDALAAGNMRLAYQLWKPDPARYTMNDFMTDWGPSGYYGPVKSYRVESAATASRSETTVVVTVEVSPDQPFPDNSDVDKSRRIKEVQIWVDKTSKALSFPGYP